MRAPKKVSSNKQSQKVSFDPDTAQNVVNVMTHGLAAPALGYGMYKLGKGVQKTYRQFKRMGQYMKGKN